jgi:hypothetical protein
MRFLTHRHPDLCWVFACRFLFIWIQNRREIVIKNVNKQLNPPSVKTSGKHERSRSRFNLKQIPFDEISRLRSGPPFTLRMVSLRSNPQQGCFILIGERVHPFLGWFTLRMMNEVSQIFCYYLLLSTMLYLQFTNKRLVICISCFHSPFLFSWNK